MQSTLRGEVLFAMGCGAQYTLSRSHDGRGSMKVRFQADADLNQIIVSAVVRRVMEIDFRTGTAARLAGVRDPKF